MMSIQSRTETYCKGASIFKVSDTEAHASAETLEGFSEIPDLFVANCGKDEPRGTWLGAGRYGERRIRNAHHSPIQCALINTGASTRRASPVVRIFQSIAMIALSFLASSTVQAAPITPSPSDDMTCSTDGARSDRDEALQGQIAATANGPIAYYRFGQGNPLVLITGYRADLSEWNTHFLAELAKSNQVILFDNRGIGRSATNLENYRVDTLARDTSALIKALGFDSATILGWSMGGIIAQRLAMDEPMLVNHLVLLSSEPPGPTSIPVSADAQETLSGRGKSSFETVMNVLFPAAAEQRAKDCFIQGMFKPRDYAPGDVSSAVTSAQENLLQEWQGDMQATEQLRHLKIPTLVLTGTEDEVFDGQNSVILSRIIPDAKLVEIKSGGHAMMYQYPKLLADQINAFIHK